MYATDEILETMLNDPDTMITILEKYKNEKERRLIAEQQVQELQPKATYYDEILNNKSLISVSQISKDYGMSATKFNKLLNDLRIQYKRSEQWLLYSHYQDKGYTQSKTHKYKKYNGSTGVKMQTKWTQKGRLFLYEELKKINILPMIER